MSHTKMFTILKVTLVKKLLNRFLYIKCIKYRVGVCVSTLIIALGKAMVNLCVFELTNRFSLKVLALNVWYTTSLMFCYTVSLLIITIF